MTEQHTAAEPDRDRLTLEISRGQTGALQLSIDQTRECGSGRSYRLAGPRPDGSEETLLSHELGRRDADAIRGYLDAVFPARTEHDSAAQLARVGAALAELRARAAVEPYTLREQAFEVAARLLEGAMLDAPLHYTLDGVRSVCGEIARLKGGGQFRLAFDPDDDQIDCAGCRMYLAGALAGKGGA